VYNVGRLKLRLKFMNYTDINAIVQELKLDVEINDTLEPKGLYIKHLLFKIDKTNDIDSERFNLVNKMWRLMLT
jgi:hypothetical protein